MKDSYAEAIDLERMERQLARCSAQDASHPPDACCARRTALESVCPCLLCEDAICNALTTAVYEALETPRQ